MDRSFLLHDASRLLRATGLGVALDEVHPLDEHAALLRQHLDDLAGLPALLPGDHHHIVIFADEQAHGYSTSGARETIFMNRFALSSRATGPKIRVPTGSFWLSIRTAELLSKRI